MSLVQINMFKNILKIAFTGFRSGVVRPSSNILCLVENIHFGITLCIAFSTFTGSLSISCRRLQEFSIPLGIFA